MAIPAQKSDQPLPGDMTGFQISVKVEDRVSTGSGGSAVVDEEALQLVDSGDSYFQSVHYPQCLPRVDGLHSELEDDGRSYFTDVFAMAEQPQQEEGEPLGWWVWS